jgi:hypothetical protein
VHLLGAGRDRLEHVGDGRQILVLDQDRLRRCHRLGLALGGDRGNGLAVEAHLVDRDHGPVADRMTPELVDVGEIAIGEDADDTRHRLGDAGVDRDDARVRHRRAQHLAVQHPREHDVTCELGLAAQLLPCVAAGCRAPDLARPRKAPDRHGSTPAISRTASRMPR